MGLAASQARLLMLTSRKDDVEAQLMMIANQKLSLSRQSASLSDDYNNALNATSLAWKTTSGNVDLSYGLLMQPHTDNVGQYIVTNAATGSVILDNNYISRLGLPVSGNSGDLSVLMGDGINPKENFLMKMMGCTKEQADNYVNSHVTNNPTTNDVKFTTHYTTGNVLATISQNPNGGYNNPINYYTNSAITVDITKLYTTINNVGEDLTKALKSILSRSTQLGSDESKIDSKLNTACDYAVVATYNKFFANKVDTTADADNIGQAKTTDGKPICGTSTSNQIYQDGSNYKINVTQLVETFLDFFDYYCAKNYGCDKSNTQTQNEDTANWITSRVGTGYQPAPVQTGTDPNTGQPIYTTPAYVGGSTTYRMESSGGTGSKSQITSDETTTTSGSGTTNSSDNYEANYYLNLYDAINSFGWQTNDSTNSKGFIENELLNGNIAIKQRQDDGTWVTTTTSDYDSPLVTVDDDTAVTKAEADYNSKKDLLDSKESELDLKSKSLDTERTSITTEIDTVNGIIKKRIESSFKMFQA